MSEGVRVKLEEQGSQIRRDIAEVDDQARAGEFDETTARRLRETYRSELEAVDAALAGLPSEDVPPARGRMVVGTVILVVGLAVSVVVAGSMLGDGTNRNLEGVAGGELDLDSVSNETMEAVIESYRDDPAVATQLPLMEFRLAERYFEEAAYDKAFGHYRSVIENAESTGEVVAPALARVGWIVWVLNGETDLALETLDRSLDIEPADPEALYVKGQILWCGAGDPVTAATLFEQVLDTSGLPDEVVAQVEVDLELTSAGESCG